MDKSDLIVQPIISNDFLLKNSSSVVTLVIEKSKVSEKWRVDFDLMEQRKRTFIS